MISQARNRTGSALYSGSQRLVLLVCDLPVHRVAPVDGEWAGLT
jgi:hypothetical protein